MAAELKLLGARKTDLAAVSELLAAAKLVPLDDTAQLGPQYAVAENAEGVIVGVAGYERYGGDILLRSVAVAESQRSTGVGARLTADHLSNARAAGCSSAYLLTDTASGYWQRRGFIAIDRTAAPVAITQSKEWIHACPATAAAMPVPENHLMAREKSDLSFRRAFPDSRQ